MTTMLDASASALRLATAWHRRVQLLHAATWVWRFFPTATALVLAPNATPQDPVVLAGVIDSGGRILWRWSDPRTPLDQGSTEADVVRWEHICPLITAAMTSARGSEDLTDVGVGLTPVTQAAFSRDPRDALVLVDLPRVHEAAAGTGDVAQLGSRYYSWWIHPETPLADRTPLPMVSLPVTWATTRPGEAGMTPLLDISVAVSDQSAAMQAVRAGCVSVTITVAGETITLAGAPRVATAQSRAEGPPA